MTTIIQNAINQLSIKHDDQQKLFPGSVKIQTQFAPLLPYDVMKLKGQMAGGIGRVPGYGAVGRVVEVGALRKPQHLLNRDVFVLEPSGTFKNFIISNFPPLVIPFDKQKTIKNAEIASIAGGVDTAYMLYKKIIHHAFNNLILIGANGVIGLSLIQLLKQLTDIQVYPHVRPASLPYFEKKRATYNLTNIHDDEANLNPKNTLVMDLTGKVDEVKAYVNQYPVWSLAIQSVSAIQFISQPIMPKDYHFLIKMIINNQIHVPIDKSFKMDSFTEAFDYQAKGHSRGRNLLVFT